MFDACFFVNMDRSTARRDRFLANVAAVDDWPFPAPVRWAGVDEEPPEWWHRGYYGTPRGGWGCLRAHLSLYEHCILNGIESAVIFEDDCLFPRDFGAKVRDFVPRVPDDWDCLHFGGNHYLIPEPVNEHVLRCINTNMSISYVVRGAARAAPLYFLARFFGEASKQEPHIDRIWGTLQKAGRVRAYAPWDWITGSAPGKSDATGWEWQEEWFHLPVETKAKLKELIPC